LADFLADLPLALAVRAVFPRSGAAAGLRVLCCEEFDDLRGGMEIRGMKVAT
jgi:hypothetical protein